jgi:ABC-type uncharacterized transport system ATPase subunit
MNLFRTNDVNQARW